MAHGQNRQTQQFIWQTTTPPPKEHCILFLCVGGSSIHSTTKMPRHFWRVEWSKWFHEVPVFCYLYYLSGCCIMYGSIMSLWWRHDPLQLCCCFYEVNLYDCTDGHEVKFRTLLQFARHICESLNEWDMDDAHCFCCCRFGFALKLRKH